MGDTLTLEALGQEVRQRLEGVSRELSERTSDTKLGEMIEDSFKRFIESDSGKEYVRKIRFAQPDKELMGTKYSRAGLTVSDVELLHDITLSAGQRGLGAGPSEELRNTFSAVSKGEYKDTTTLRSEGERQLTDMFQRGELSVAGYERALRAMDTAESGFGSQLVGAQYVSELWRGAEAESRVFGLIRTFEMTAPTAYLPVQATLPVVKYVQESTVANSAPYATTKTGSNRVQTDAKKLLMHQIYSGEMEEDSLIPYVPFIREEASRSWGLHMDSVVLNGDNTDAATGNINEDDVDPSGDEYFLAFDGIRHAGLVDNINNRLDAAGALTLAMLKNQRTRMLDRTYKHDWSHPNNPDDLVYLCDPETSDAISFWDEFMTLDKFGPNATIFTGSQGKVLNHQVIPSIMMSLTEADGKPSGVTPANNVKGQLVSFNRRGAVIGWRRQMKAEVERIPSTDQTRIVWSTRLGMGRFSPTGNASGIEWADVIYNITL